MTAYLYYPSWLRPEIIPGLPFHWYGMMYLVAFGLTYILFRYDVNQGALDISEDTTNSYFFWTILALLLGARIVAALVYDPSGRYVTAPWLIFWPYDGRGNFTGLQGMSYHGGVIGAVAGAYLFAKIKKMDFFRLADVTVAAIPLGYTFGRIGNFINGELWGRVTTVGWGVVFPRAPGFSTDKEWVRDIADQVGMDYDPGMLLNLPRHPSQLYEAFFEGVFLWLLLWFGFRKRSPFSGFVLGLYLIGYGTVRFFIEYVREPDTHMGFPIQLAREWEPTALFLSPWNISMGQLLCCLMIIAGGVLLIARGKSAAGQRIKEEKAQHISSRKLRKKIK